MIIKMKKYHIFEVIISTIIHNYPKSVAKFVIVSFVVLLLNKQFLGWEYKCC